MLLHLPPKGGLVNPQGLGGSQTVPIVVPQRLEDDVGLEVVQRARSGNRGGLIGGAERLWKVLRMNHAAGAEDERVLDDVLEFAHVSG